MTKRLIVSVIFLCVAIALGISSHLYVNKCCEASVKSIDYAVSQSQADNLSVNTITELHKSWEDSSFILNILINKNNVSEIKTDLDTAIFYAETGDVQSFVLKSQECKEKLTNIMVSYKFSFENIL